MSFEFDNDEEAASVLSRDRFSLRKGVIEPLWAHVVETPLETAAINYLFQEWDYGYIPYIGD